MSRSHHGIGLASLLLDDPGAISAAARDAAEYLAAHIHEAPVWIVPCLEGGAAGERELGEQRRIFVPQTSHEGWDRQGSPLSM